MLKHKFIRPQKTVQSIVLLIVGLCFSVSLLATPAVLAATGDASFSLSPSSRDYSVGSTLIVDISETSSVSDNANAAQVNLSYPANTLTYTGSNLTGPFTLCAQNSGGNGIVNIACATPNPESGTQAVAAVTFKVIGTGNASISMSSGSDIVNTSGSSVWNEVLPTVTYNLTAVDSSAPVSNTSPSQTSGPSATTSQSTAVSLPVSLGSISITVTNAQGKRLSNARVSLNGITHTTNPSGVVNFAAVDSGKHQVSIQAAGQKPFEASISLRSGQNALVAYRLAAAKSIGSTLPYIAIGTMLALIAAALVLVWYIRFYSGRRFGFAQASTKPSMATTAAPAALATLPLRPQPSVNHPAAMLTDRPARVTPQSFRSPLRPKRPPRRYI